MSNETYTDPQGFVWEQPTAWAYFAACRALNWRNAQLHALGWEPRQIDPDDPCMPPDGYFDEDPGVAGNGFNSKKCSECGTPLDEVPLTDCATHAANNPPPSFDETPIAPPDAPAADSMIDMLGRCANIIRKLYFRYTRNERVAYQAAEEVLQEVQRTYEQLTEKADPRSLS